MKKGVIFFLCLLLIQIGAPKSSLKALWASSSAHQMEGIEKLEKRFKDADSEIKSLTKIKQLLKLNQWEEAEKVVINNRYQSEYNFFQKKGFLLIAQYFYNQKEYKSVLNTIHKARFRSEKTHLHKQALQLKTRALIGLKKYNEALKAYKSILILFPEKYKNKALQAAVEQSIRKKINLKTLLNQAELMQLIKNAFAINEFDYVIEYAKQALSRSKNENNKQELQWILAKSYIKKERFRQALVHLIPLLNTQVSKLKKAEISLEVGKIYEFLMQHDKAIKMYQSAVFESQKSQDIKAEAYLALLKLTYQKNRVLYENQLKIFEKQYRTSPIKKEFERWRKWQDIKLCSSDIELDKAMSQWIIDKRKRERLGRILKGLKTKWAFIDLNHVVKHFSLSENALYFMQNLPTGSYAEWKNKCKKYEKIYKKNKIIESKARYIYEKEKGEEWLFFLNWIEVRQKKVGQINKNASESNQRWNQNNVVNIYGFYPWVYEEKIKKIAEKNNIDPLFMLSIAKVSSGYNPFFDSKDRKGLMGLRKEVEKPLENRVGILKQTQRTENEINILLATEHIKSLYDTFNDMTYTLIAYRDRLKIAKTIWGLKGIHITPDQIQNTDQKKFVEDVLNTYMILLLLYQE